MEPTPIEIRLRKQSRLLTLVYADEQQFDLSFEYLRVHSPSAEVQGHGPGQERLQTGKEEVAITAVEPIGHYAVRLVFDDGHDSGLYTWQHLYDLGQNQASRWQTYLDRLEAAGHTRKSH